MLLVTLPVPFLLSKWAYGKAHQWVNQYLLKLTFQKLLSSSNKIYSILKIMQLLQNLEKFKKKLFNI